MRSQYTKTNYDFNPLELMMFERKYNPLEFVGKKGIYFLINEKEIVYVGQSTNIGNRIFSHKNGKKSKKQPCKKFTHYTFLELDSDYDEFCRVEGHYIIKYRPKYNITIPKNTITKTTFVKDLL